MALDLNETAKLIDSLAGGLRQQRDDWSDKLRLALETLAQADAAQLQAKAQASKGKVTWLVAGIEEGLAERHPASPFPSDHAVLAVDGSHIDVDRHTAPRCYLINIGTVELRYGAEPQARLTSHPRLASSEEELVVADPTGVRQQPIEGALLGIMRAVEEVRALAVLVEASPSELPTLALLDGSLILWGLAGQAYPEFVKRALLEQGLLPALERLRRASAERPLALASYISLPRSTDVVNALRLHPSLCPYETANCEQCGIEHAGQLPCNRIGGLTDRDLLGQTLEPGQRSSLFSTRSSVVEQYYGEHQVEFFYVNVGQEVARVELPAWVARDGHRLELAHALLLEQCRKGQGYPVALMEAHEQAVVSVQDREMFRQLVEEALAGQRLSSYTSEKSRSKRLRWL
ncbi:MAG: DNA double-strand break repair nuclease NurA [Dehalococcoidia bacterium]